MWDDEVDVVCCGSGFGAMAVAVAAAAAGLDVHIAGSAPTGGTQPHPASWLGAGISDPETRDYFDALSADLLPGAEIECDAELAARVVSDGPPRSRRGRIAPFFGARLGQWAQTCLSSPYGVLYTRLADRGTTSMTTRTGEEIAVALLGALETDGPATSATLGQWLSTQVAEHQIPVSDSGTLQRLVFEEGQVIGAVIDTADGPLALRARHGVAVSTEPRGSAPVSTDGQLISDQPVQVGLVGYNASRFGRVELLQVEADGAQPEYCSSGGRPDSRRESGRSPTRRGREMHRHPPFGQ
ncbi:FAD-binding protein [Mycobacterium sp. TNTM28]|uniref:FAD-binding protein n=1 Tax=[Mycobacterium] fortunisiensis TaxID=2600579 RepID=A0ABS6KKY5_9MYCO|nr:FAD-binding protein [[Mycobacterium] fortunisiensis]MBU9764259.1 FAD-binding protein [[Mycobacterium] fortunisiensis]